jgi:hypothetical protein
MLQLVEFSYLTRLKYMLNLQDARMNAVLVGGVSLAIAYWRCIIEPYCFRTLMPTRTRQVG